MPRIPRIKGEFTTYHIILRGNEKKNIFVDSFDKKRFLETLATMKEKYNFQIYSYCLMNNHVHLIIYDNGNDISLIMKSVNISYAMYFNSRYKRTGHLFQDRFKSQVVDDEGYLLELSKYIHNNPVKAGIAENAGEYEWSSFREFVGGEQTAGAGEQSRGNYLVSVSKILNMLSGDRQTAQKIYCEAVNNQENNPDLSQTDGFITAEEDNIDYYHLLGNAKQKLSDIALEKNLTIQELINKKSDRDDAIRELRKNTSMTLKEIGNLMGGLSESRISRILKGKSGDGS